MKYKVIYNNFGIIHVLIQNFSKIFQTRECFHGIPAEYFLCWSNICIDVRTICCRHFVVREYWPPGLWEQGRQWCCCSPLLYYSGSGGNGAEIKQSYIEPSSLLIISESKYQPQSISFSFLRLATFDVC